MSQPAERMLMVDPVWSALRSDAAAIAAQEPALASLVHATILTHDRLEGALSYHLAKKLHSEDASAMLLRELFEDQFLNSPQIGEAVRADLSAVVERDPAARGHVQPFLFFKGFHALQAYRLANRLWRRQRQTMALFLQNKISEVFGVDIHPAAQIGRGVMIDHGTGVVIGETAIVEDDVSMLHGVTLGGTGKETGDRHPKVRKGVLIGAGAKLLGNIEVGAYSRVGAGSVVLAPVPPHCTVAGVPAKVVGCAGCDDPARQMDQMIDVVEPDYVI
ncbi:MAG: serine O-acetyltransferase [Alphaproteobacteria bacterium]|nr:serine O-acetyltransferase [Alphaproteobacteria bacterium]